MENRKSDVLFTKPMPEITPWFRPATSVYLLECPSPDYCACQAHLRCQTVQLQHVNMGSSSISGLQRGAEEEIKLSRSVTNTDLLTKHIVWRY